LWRLHLQIKLRSNYYFQSGLLKTRSVWQQKWIDSGTEPHFCSFVGNHSSNSIPIYLFCILNWDRSKYFIKNYTLQPSNHLWFLESSHFLFEFRRLRVSNTPTRTHTHTHPTLLKISTSHWPHTHAYTKKERNRERKRKSEEESLWTTESIPFIPTLIWSLHLQSTALTLTPRETPWEYQTENTSFHLFGYQKLLHDKYDWIPLQIHTVTSKILRHLSQKCRNFSVLDKILSQVPSANKLCWAFTP